MVFNECMTYSQTTCTHCNKKLLRHTSWINENKKLDYKHYCSLKCVGESKKLRKTLVCLNPACKKRFVRRIKDISPNNYCSRTCAVTINNKKYPKNPGVRKKCKYCGKEFVSRKKYCSRRCKDKGSLIREEEVANKIREFYKVNGRIPFKREFSHPRAARERFGTWNNAIKEAGFEPNPVMFSKKHIANDGHKCDSLAEKIIDDWLYARKIEHKINVSYPGNCRFTVDFKVGDYWVEFFGLSGGHKRYDELKNKKLNLAKKQDLKLLEIYPHHLFPTSYLDEELRMLIIKI